MKPDNFAERIVWYSLIFTYGFYLVGGLYLVGPATAWILLIYLCKKLWEQNESTPEEEQITISWQMWVWIGAMLIELFALVVGHLDWRLGNVAIIKSSVGWARSWALLAIFPMFGCLKIRPRLIYRAVCIVCLQTIIIAPFLYLTYLAKLPPTVYTSPLQYLGGGGELFFRINLYLGDGRLVFFAPWAPAIGTVGNIYFFIALQEKNTRWRWCGLVGSFLMCYLSAARAATLCLPLILLGVWGLTKITRHFFIIAVGFTTALVGILAPSIIDVVAVYWDNLRSSRAGSTRVRDALTRIAFRRWSEAPIWGHGVVQPGPQMVEFMKIGTHNTYLSLLFVKGIVGLIAFVVPLVVSFIDFLFKAQTSNIAKLGLSVLLILIFYGFSANLESIAYLYWPGLVVMGQAMQEKLPSVKKVSLIASSTTN
ncbi:O-antigen ligase family protein [Lyngbya aestuarii]|uniref:O-antigen ligase family protein n=1 Tax=Lyngbya aestuarii TaxID=118322 RepID=UPI00403DCE53